MARSAQVPGAGRTGSPSRAVCFEELATHQYLNCLAALGRREEIEAFLRSSAGQDQCGSGRYHLALVLARENSVSEAMVQLRKLLAENPTHTDARRLAYRLLLKQAEHLARTQDWETLTGLVAEALELGPQGVDAEADLGRFKHAVPVGHVRSGNREEAGRLWEEQLEKHPADVRLLHNLAILHHWWASGLERDGQDPRLTWQAAIAYWTVLINSDPFWRIWGETRKRIWGFELSEADLETFRRGFIETHLEHSFQAKVDDSKRNGQTDMARMYEDCLTATTLERKSAECWGKALALMPVGKRSQGLLGLPGGVLFFRLFGLVPKLLAAVTSLAGSEAAECAAHIQIYFSPAGLGTVAVLLQERNKPDEALGLLKAMPQSVRESLEARYLEILGLDRKAAVLTAQGKLLIALETWKTARKQIKDALAKCPKGSVHAALLESLRSSISDQVTKGAEKEAGRYKKAEKYDQAISLLEKAVEVDDTGTMLEFLCIYLCDRGHVKVRAEDLGGARSDFSRALKLTPGHVRAQEGLSTVLNNQACKETNHDKAIAMFDEALKLEPNSQLVQRNLAQELKGKAVELFNAIRPPVLEREVAEPIRCLERAVKLPCFDLKPEAVDLIESAAVVGAAEVLYSKISDTKILLPIVKDLVYLYQVRRQARGY